MLTTQRNVLEIGRVKPSFHLETDRAASEFAFIPGEVYDVEFADKQMSYRFDVDFGAAETALLEDLHAAFHRNLLLVEAAMDAARKRGRADLEPPIFQFLAALAREGKEARLGAAAILQMLLKSTPAAF